MKKNISLIIIIAVFVVLIGGAYVLYNRLSADNAADTIAVNETQTTAAPDTSAEGTAAPELVAAPDFTVYDANGNGVKLSDFIGKPLVLNFWASWCGPCKSEMPEFDEVYKELGDNVQFMMVNMTDGSRETQEAASGYIAENGYSFPVFYDTDMEAAITYGVNAIPMTLFIDADGNAVAQARSAIDMETLRKGIDMITQ